MNGYREQKSRQSGRSGRRSLASRGNASIQSITPSAMDRPGRSRQSGLSASERMSVQPSVCGVQPGRVLELRTTLGLMRARAMLEQQIEQDRIMDERQTGDQRQKGQLLKHGKLKPLGVVSDPLMLSNSCLGIVSVNSQSSNYQRPRSCTTPEVHLGNSGSTPGDLYDDSEGLSGKGMKVRKRSYSAMVPRNVTIDQMREPAANLSITKQTALIPEEDNATNTTCAESNKTTLNSNTDNEQTQTKASQTGTSQSNKAEAQKSSNSEHDLETAEDTSTGKIQILPPVVRQGELGMKVEVRRLRTFSDSVVSETASTTLAVDGKQQTGIVAANSRAIKRLPKLQEKEKKQTEKSSHISSQSPETREKPKDDPSDRTSTSASSLRRVSIVSLGETQSKSQHTDRHRQQRRKRRHSEGKQAGSGRLSQGWSPPQLNTIEPIVGSPLHTPRKQTQTTGDSHAVGAGGPGEQGSLLDLEALRSQMTSPGMLISVDVNEFLQDIDPDDPA